MSKRYTIYIDVKGQEEAVELAESFEEIAEGADNADVQIAKLNKGVDENTTAIVKNTGAQTGMTEATKDNISSLGLLAGSMAAGFARAKALTFVMARWAKFIPIVGTAIAILIGTIVLYNKALKAANDFLNSNVEAQQKMFSQTTAATAWANIWKDVSIWFGEFFHSFRDFWSFFKNIAGNEILKSIGLEEYVYDAQDAIEAQNRLNTEWEESLTRIQELTFASEDYLKIINDETRSNEDRIKGAIAWSTAQLEILDINKKRLEDQQLLLNSRRVLTQEERNQLEQINRSLLENDRLRTNVAYSTAEMTKNILLNVDALEDEEHAIGGLIDTMRSAGLGVDEDEPFLLSRAMTPDEAQLEIDAQRWDAYKEMLRGNLETIGGEYAYYIETVMALETALKNWTILETAERVAAIAMGATMALGIANQMFQQLADSSNQDFESQKKYRIAGATISMLQGIVGAYAGAFASIPNPLAALIVGTAMAAGVGIMGGMNIAKIKKSQPGMGDTGNIPSGGGGGAPAISSAPSFSLVNPLTGGEEAIAGAIGAETEPAKAYVVSTDMTTQQALDRNIEANASL